MDKRLEQAFESGRFRMVLSTRQKNLKKLLNNRLMFSYEGGLFKITQELIAFVSVIVLRQEKEYIFLDANDFPILIADLEKFLDKLIKKYSNGLKQYYSSYDKLIEAKNIRNVVDWNDD